LNGGDADEDDCGDGNDDIDGGGGSDNADSDGDVTTMIRVQCNAVCNETMQ
jgi:hypothetical protein